MYVYIIIFGLPWSLAQRPPKWRDERSAGTSMGQAGGPETLGQRRNHGFPHGKTMG